MTGSWNIKMKGAGVAAFFALVLVSAALAQDDKKWVKMTIEDATKTLSSSAWAQSQTDTDTSEMFWSPTRPGTASIQTPASGRVTPVGEQQERNNNRADRGALNQAISTNYNVRFFSSRPIREALARIVLVNHPEPGPRLLKEWQDFVERDFGPFIVLSVTCSSTDGRLLGPSLQAFNSSTSETLKNTTYLERSDGKRVYLIDYRPPLDDGLGAKFVFPRFLDGEPFLIAPKGTVRFVTDMRSAVKINVRFNVASMVWKDRVEY